MKGSDVIKALKKKLGLKTNQDLTKKIGITQQAIYNWNQRTVITARQIAGLVQSARKTAARESQYTAIRTIVEFFPVDKCRSKQDAAFELFNVGTTGKPSHPYLKGLRNELKQYHGVYIFFDSRGQAIYAGKAKKQRLWREIKGAFNRKRGDVQRIKRVKHPNRKVQYRTSNEKSRPIKDQPVPLYELAAYFSAYDVSNDMINEVEALLVRSFANDLLNKRMERFEGLR
jgi:hypothetical protein